MITFRGVYPASDDSLILTAAANPILPAIGHSSIKIPQRAGVLFHDKTHDEREISLTYELNGKSAARNAALAAQLADWAESAVAGQLVFDEMPDRFYLAILTDATPPNYADAFPSITLKFLCADPYAYALIESTANMGGTINYLGTARAYPIITYQPEEAQPGGYWQIGSKRVTLSSDYTIASGHTISIDSANRLITDNGANILRYMTIASDWLCIERGGMKTSGTGGVITWRNTYL